METETFEVRRDYRNGRCFPAGEECVHSNMKNLMCMSPHPMGGGVNVPTTVVNFEKDLDNLRCM